MVKVTSTNPADIFGLKNKGGIYVGKDADMVIFDPSSYGVFSAENLVSRSEYCLYENMEYEGAVKLVLLRGSIVYCEGIALKKGEYVRCKV